MTTIVAVQYPDKVVFAADSQVSAPTGRRSSHKKMTKMNERNGFIIAGSGECAPCDIAQHIFIPPKPTAMEKKDLYHFMIVKFIPALKECFKDNDYKVETENGETAFAFLISYAGEVFEVSDDFSICLDSKGFYGVGSGSNYALGALHAGATPQKAIEIASLNDIYTSGPFVVLTQKK